MDHKQKSSNVVWQKRRLKQSDREKRNAHKGVILWLTGLSASGKTTVAFGLEETLFENGIHCYTLDGDNVRHGLNSDMGFTHEDRKENIRRIGEVAKILMDAGTIVITAFISPYRDDRNLVRDLVEQGQFVEIFVDCPVEVCEKRDPKGLYKKARAGEIEDFTGISAPYEAPLSPEIHLNTAQDNPNVCVNAISAYLYKHKVISQEIAVKTK